ncbi:DeoR/GlpR family DNA-binding transcription regulator [Vibrio porteresiae]|uniref:DeoR/GlpR family DNA-binding transcription regulator n=1 Tax=Vibrio porteresiae DSM 19223 TaxID=1123496 RepID=A0ABZ0Q7U1_9VIBR|nr:DeoR/GlpR family DNA-binding transcription regulator [Vibrio porteresiae]WPC72506.1 DeoR/GlpR family DNA-binding transcription regulator [Vibrio porteresiae DSM 19223]
MSLSTRQKQILQELQQSQGVLTSGHLAQHLDVSVQTIRKDMNELNDLGLLKRVHGGVCLPTPNDNLSFSNRELQNSAQKQQIAQLLVNHLPEQTSIFLGIGTTPKYVAQALLDHSGLTVITNNLNAALVLSHNPNISLHLAGGAVRHSDQDTVGEITTDFYRQFNIKIGVFGVGGLNAKGELLDFTPEEAALNRAIISQSEQCWLVADHTKYGRYAPVVSATLNDIDRLFVDKPTVALKKLCQAKGVEIVSADDRSHEQKE